MASVATRVQVALAVNLDSAAQVASVAIQVRVDLVASLDSQV